MFDAIGEARVDLLAAEMEVRLAGMAHRPGADAVVELEQAGLARHLGTRLGRNQPARRGRGDRRLLIARALAQEAAGSDRDDARLRRRRGLPALRTLSRSGG